MTELARKRKGCACIQGMAGGWGWWSWECGIEPTVSLELPSPQGHLKSCHCPFPISALPNISFPLRPDSPCRADENPLSPCPLHPNTLL